MSSCVLSLLLLLLLAADAVTADVFLWPQPRSIVWGSGPAIPLAHSFYFRLASDSAPAELTAAADRYRTLIFQEKWVPVQVPYNSSGSGSRTSRHIETPAAASPLPYLTITVADPAADLQQGVNESYSLVVPDAGGDWAVLEASTVWAAIHGLETFSQLVTWQGGAGSNDTAGGALVVEHGVRIEDAPLYPYRGVMLDVARNFYPVDDLKRTVRALSYSKLNVLHLHLTDSQSFPLDLPSEPNLALEGTFGPQFIYSTTDIQDLVAYARSYGVRIIPEIDMPGHSGSWGGAYPDIVTCRDKNWVYPDGTLYAVEPAPGQLNPLKEQTYEVVANVVSDVAAAFPDSMFHAGGDEPQETCWLDSADIAAYVAGGGTLSSLIEVFVNRTRGFIADSNKTTVVYWEDVFVGHLHVSTAALPPESVVLETWNGGPVNTKLLTAAGYRTIVASSDFLYLDCGRGEFVGNATGVDVPVDPSPGTPSYNYGGSGGSWCAPYKSWQRIYDYDIVYNLTEAEAALVLGAEAALWSEQADGAVVDGLLWPRAAALAESLWSGNRDPASGALRSVDALYRLNDWRYRLLARGIQAMALQPYWCLKHPGECNNEF